MDANLAAGSDLPGDQGQRGRRPWDTDNEDALGVFQRSQHDWDTGLLQVTAANDGIGTIIGRQRGRGTLSLWVPAQVNIAGTMTATPAGVAFAPTPDTLPLGLGVPLNVGDSVVIASEGSAYATLLPGQTVGYVAWLVTLNPINGGLGAT
jgi:hypothetical protein